MRKKEKFFLIIECELINTEKNDLRKSLVNAKTCGLMFEKTILI